MHVIKCLSLPGRLPHFHFGKSRPGVQEHSCIPYCLTAQQNQPWGEPCLDAQFWYQNTFLADTSQNTSVDYILITPVIMRGFYMALCSWGLFCICTWGYYRPAGQATTHDPFIDKANLPLQCWVHFWWPSDFLKVIYFFLLSYLLENFLHLRLLLLNSSLGTLLVWFILLHMNYCKITLIRDPSQML